MKIAIIGNADMPQPILKGYSEIVRFNAGGLAGRCTIWSCGGNSAKTIAKQMHHVPQWLWSALAPPAIEIPPNKIKIIPSQFIRAIKKKIGFAASSGIIVSMWLLEAGHDIDLFNFDFFKTINPYTGKRANHNGNAERKVLERYLK